MAVVRPPAVAPLAPRMKGDPFETGAAFHRRWRRVIAPVPATPRVYAQRKEALMAGTDDRVEGKWDETKGKVKEGLGDAIDDESLEREGKGDQVEGKKEQAEGHLKEAASDMREGANEALDS